MRCDCPTRRIPGVPGHPSTDRHVKDHTPDCPACRECINGTVMDSNRKRWRCSACGGMGRRPSKKEAA